jgi:hypothetical protein
MDLTETSTDPLTPAPEIEHSLDARRAKPLAVPSEPTEQERQLHKLTHLPYRTWCPICVAAKGKLSQHRTSELKQPVTTAS